MNKIISLSTVLIILSFIFGPPVVKGGIISGAILALSMCILYNQFPSLLKKFINKTWLFWDIIITISISALIPGAAVTSIVGALTAGIIISITFHFSKSQNKVVKQ